MSGAKNSSQVLIQADVMERLVTTIFSHAGCSDAEAMSIGTRLTGANLRGHDSHGVIRTPRYVEWLDDGKVFAGREISILSDSGPITVIDGNYGFGQTVGEQAVDVGIRNAREHGVGIIALRNAGHLGRIGDWAERAVESNMVSIHMVNVRGSLLVAPFGGVDRRGSTSPFCAGIPRVDAPPVILDFATSLVAEGKALVALRGGKPLPAGSIVGSDGQLSSDPQPLYGDIPEGRYPDPNQGPGALTGFGLHKGSGLNFLMEMMAGALGGSGTSGAVDDVQRRRFCNGMFSIYLDVERFHSDDWFDREVAAYIDFVRSSRPVTAGAGVLVPGDMERITMAERRQNGLPLATEAWTDILAAADRVGVSADLKASIVDA